MTINKFECLNVCVSKDQNTATLTLIDQSKRFVFYFLKFGFVLTHYQLKIKFERHILAAKAYDLL